MIVEDDSDLEKWGIPRQPSQQQRAVWSEMNRTWQRFSGHMPEPSLDIGAANSKGRTVSLDPFPRGRVDVRAIGEMLPFIDCHFSSVILESVLKHVLSPEQTLDEAYRVLKKGSYLYVTSPVNHIDSHRHSFSFAKLCSMIEKSGFRIVRKMGLGLSHSKLDRIFKRRVSGLYSHIRVPVRVCSTLYVVAEKI
jgi:SAM-dependent methyltransferase